MDGWMGGWVDGWMGGCVDGWMYGWMDETEASISFFCNTKMKKEI